MRRRVSRVFATVIMTVETNTRAKDPLQAR
jgi:hypothetical protein